MIAQLSSTVVPGILAPPPGKVLLLSLPLFPGGSEEPKRENRKRNAVFLRESQDKFILLCDDISSQKDLRCLFGGCDDMYEISSLKKIRCFFFGGTILSLRYVHGKKKLHVFMKNITHDEHRENFYVMENIKMSIPNV